MIFSSDGIVNTNRELGRRMGGALSGTEIMDYFFLADCNHSDVKGT